MENETSSHNLDSYGKMNNFSMGSQAKKGLFMFSFMLVAIIGIFFNYVRICIKFTLNLFNISFNYIKILKRKILLSPVFSTSSLRKN